VVLTEQIIGFDKTGLPANAMVILTDAGGRIVTAFPVSLQQDISEETSHTNGQEIINGQEVNTG
jgi:hypothetical protein